MTHETMLIGRILNGCLLCAAVWIGCDPAQVSAAPPHDTRQAVPLYDNLGALHHAITTSSDQAQRYFDQGLRFVYAFNHEEAIQAFEEAATLDPTAGMAYWGVAFALGPNINAAMGKQQERRAVEALSKARAHSAKLGAAERGYIEALSKRYLSKSRSRAVLDKTYADAMRALWREFPDDPDVGVLFAEAMMDLRPWGLMDGGGAAKAWHGGDRFHLGVDPVEASRSPRRLSLLYPCGRGLAGA
jgi:tetratricopeptide (TPR) repeat protein